MTNIRSTGSFDGTRIVYDVVGASSDARTIVFVHGWTCNRVHWSEQVAEFSDRYRVIAIDLAGHGESDLGRVEYSMSAFAKDVAAVMNAERVDRAVLVGHSMGGMVILHAAQQLGERVVGLVGADTFKYLREDPSTGKQAEQFRVLLDDYEGAMVSTVSSMFTDKSPEVLKETITEGMLATAPEVALGAMKGMADDIALFDLAAGLNIPKFTFNATDRAMDEMACREAGIVLKFHPTEGHFVMNEDADGFSRLLEQALESMF